MEKAAFKSFIYCFVFSLFAILATNRMFFSTPIKASQNLKISNKNILLFVKNSDFEAIRPFSQPTKKIILSSVADIVPKQKTEEEKVFSENNAKNVEKTVIAEVDFIPLEEKAPFTSKVNQEIVLAAADLPIQHKNIKQAAVSKIEAVSNPDLSFTSSLEDKKVVYTPQQKDVLPLQSTSAEMPKIVVQPENKPVADNEALRPNTTKIAQTPNEKSNSVQSYPNETNLAQTAMQEHSPQMLIPLESTPNTTFAQANIKTADDAEKNHVALNNKNVPISSMSAQIQTEEKKQANKQNWESMKDKHQAKPSDDPWVVAKGNSFPNNQMLLKDKKYNVSDDAVNKIFEASTQEKISQSQEIQLAAKTVDNLLIPIPEDILNDENLTPQLISSPENQQIKDELEAKGLIKKEEQKTEKQDDSSPASSTTQNSSQNDGILGSITSLFSGNSDKAPEIGVNDNDNEDTNSLFSAFSRKQKKLMSKILPTEIRLSFQPNRAEISGQTLRWIKAFAQKTAEEQTTGLEIRIDGTSSPLLQRRRLNLLQNILINEGAAPEKINTVFTAREPNSFILRTVRINNKKTNFQTNSNPRYMQW